MFNSLNYKVIFAIAAVIVLGALVAALIVVLTVQYQMSQKYAVEKEASIESLTLSLTGDLQSGDLEQIDQTLRSALVYENVVRVAVYDITGTTVREMDETDGGMTASDVSRHSLSVDGVSIGSFTIGFSDRYISELVSRTVIALVFVVAGFLLIVGLAFYYFVRRSILQPVRDLTATVDEIGKGNLSARIEVSSKDELGYLAEAFNRMTGNLQESQESLRRSRDELEVRVEERTRGERRRAEQLRAINEVGRRISSYLSLDELLPYVATSLKETFEFYNVNVFMVGEDDNNLYLSAGAGGYQGDIPAGFMVREGTDVTGMAAQTGDYLLVPDVFDSLVALPMDVLPDTQSELAVPIKLGDEVSGVLDIRSDETDAFDDIDVFTVQTIADQLAVAVQNARYYRETRELAVITERNRMAREIHDTLAQGFTGIIMQLEAAEQTLGEDNGVSQKHLDTARKLAKESLNEARRSVWALRPQVLEDRSLKDALNGIIADLKAGSGIQAELTTGKLDSGITPDAENALLRIAQEAVNNIRKHSHAAHVKINLAQEEHAIVMSVEDNGIGFDPSADMKDRFGLISMRERARLLGGSFEIASEPGTGTRLTVSIPFRKER